MGDIRTIQNADRGNGRPPDGADIARDGALQLVRLAALNCSLCPLARIGTNVVFGSGNAGARLVVVGEAPGAKENEAGLPFQGVAGRTLDSLLEQIGLKRDEVYVANVVMRRPPENRRPKRKEVEACAPYLDAQIRLVAPEVILALGATAARRLLDGRTAVKDARGMTHPTELGTVVATYHPSPVSRNRDPLRRLALEADLGTVRELLAHS